VRQVSEREGEEMGEVRGGEEGKEGEGREKAAELRREGATGWTHSRDITYFRFAPTCLSSLSCHWTVIQTKYMIATGRGGDMAASSSNWHGP